MDITNEAARFPKTATSIAHCRGTPQLDNSARALGGTTKDISTVRRAGEKPELTSSIEYRL